VSVRRYCRAVAASLRDRGHLDLARPAEPRLVLVDAAATREEIAAETDPDVEQVRATAATSLASPYSNSSGSKMSM